MRVLVVFDGRYGEGGAEVGLLPPGERTEGGREGELGG